MLTPIKEGAQVGPYTLDALLGRGRWGSVYRAAHEETRREVALKIITLNSAPTTPGALEQLTDGLARLERLVHPNLVQVHASGLHGDRPWVAMDRVRGQTLARFRAKARRLDVAQSTAIATQILYGLARAHQKGALHLNVTPNNVMLLESERSETPRVRVLDTGLSSALARAFKIARQQELTPAGFFGSPRYMAPEQLAEHQTGPFSDVYSVGLLIYEMLVGLPLIKGHTPFEIVQSQMRSEPHTLPSRVKDTALEPVLTRALSIDPARRYQDATEMLAAMPRVTEPGAPS